MLIKILGKAKLLVEVRDIIFRTPLIDVEVTATLKGYYQEHTFTLDEVQEGVYVAYLPKATYEVRINSRTIVGALNLNENKTITVRSTAKTRYCYCFSLVVSSIILSLVLILVALSLDVEMLFVLFLLLGGFQYTLHFQLIPYYTGLDPSDLTSFLRALELQILDPIEFLALFIYNSAVNAFLILLIIGPCIHEFIRDLTQKLSTKH